MQLIGLDLGPEQPEWRAGTVTRLSGGVRHGPRVQAREKEIF